MNNTTIPSITVIIHTFNVASQIEECVNSAKLLSNTILVVDMGSADGTVERAKKLGATIFAVPYARIVEPARNPAIRATTTDWVFLLDADERITPAVAKEIQTTLAKTTRSFFRIPRKELFAQTTWLRHGGWWPNEQIRLIKREAFVNWPENIHATPEITGTFGTLKHPILHFSKNSYESIVEKTMVFEDMESELLFHANRPVSTVICMRKFLGELNRRLIRGQGWKDGTIGIIESIYQAFSKTITYLYLYEKKNRSTV